MTAQPRGPRARRTRDDDNRQAPRLSRRGFWITLGAAIAVFLIVDNPVMGDAFSIDRSIAWSYLPIPIGVLCFLALERALSVHAFVAETTLLAIVKFGLTTALAVGLWVRAGEPAPHAGGDRAPIRRGLIVHEPLVGGAPITGSRPLAPAWTAPSGPGVGVPVLSPRAVTPGNAGLIRLTDDLHTHPGPSPVHVTAGAWALLDASDGLLHTALAVAEDGHVLFNRPLIPGSKAWPIRLDRPGRMHIRCAVHPYERYPVVIITPPSTP